MAPPVAGTNFFLLELVILSTAKKLGILAALGGCKVLVFFDDYWITPVAGRDLFLEPEAFLPAVYGRERLDRGCDCAAKT